MTGYRGRAQRYRARSEECLRLAELAMVPQIGEHYRRIAEHYLELAEAEEALAARGTIRRPGGASGSVGPDL